MKPRFLVLLAALIVAPLAARADSTVYYFQSVFPGGGTIDGDLTFNTSTDQFTAADLIPANLGSDGVALTNIEYYNDPDVIAVVENCAPGNCLPNSVTIDFQLASGVPSSTFVQYDSYLVATSSSLTPVAAPSATPEPSSFALLGSGLLGVAGVVRRRVTR